MAFDGLETREDMPLHPKADRTRCGFQPDHRLPVRLMSIGPAWVSQRKERLNVLQKLV